MRAFPTLYLLLIISLLYTSCCPASKVGEVKPAEGSRIMRFAPLDTGSESMLFKANIGLFKEHYSGLFLIKEMPDSSTHIVFLSELGLSLMDLRYQDDQFEVVSVQEFLNKASILKTLENDFRTLLLDLSAIESYSLSKTEAGDPSEVLKFRHRKEKYTYFHLAERGTYKITRKKGLFRSVEFNIEYNKGVRIEIGHKGIRLHIVLQQLNQWSDYADQ